MIRPQRDGGTRRCSRRYAAPACGDRKRPRLTLADYDPETGALTVRHGKGNKERLVYATNGGKSAIDDWLAVRGQDPGGLFVPINRGRRMALEQ